ncbi:MAG: PadR family transcriptional regulator [Longimicrobiales bacterium]
MSAQELPLTPLSTAILLALAKEELHGYALMQEVEVQSAGVLAPGTGTLYSALMRLLDDGLIEEGDAPRPDGRRGRSYRISSQGRELLRAEAERLDRVLALARARGFAPEPRPAAGSGS